MAPSPPRHSLVGPRAGLAGLCPSKGLCKFSFRSRPSRARVLTIWAAALRGLCGAQGLPKSVPQLTILLLDLKPMGVPPR